MTDRELMGQALEKLDFFAHMKSVSEDTIRLIAALRERLAQPEQEPVAYRYKYPDGFWRFSNGERVNGSDCIKSQALYTNPPQRKPWVGLTDEEIKIIWRDIDGSEGMLMRFARAIEAKLKEKNT